MPQARSRSFPTSVIIRIRRISLNLRTQLILLLGALVVVATGSLGSIAYYTSRAITEGSAAREVGVIANARRQALLQELTAQNERAAALLKTLSLGCEPVETWCLRKVLGDYVATGGATAARLTYRGHAPITIGNHTDRLSNPPFSASELAHFDIDRSGRAYYVIEARAALGQAEAVVALAGDMELVDQIFQGRYGLGQSGETFLTDAQGRFLTSHRYSAPQPGQRPGGDRAIRLCLGGLDSETLDRDYRDVPVIHGFRHMPEIGGGCVIAQIDQAEAFAPANALRRKAAIISLLLVGVAIAISILFAQLLARPIDKLEDRARSLRAGDYDSPVPVGGPLEVRVFARTFQSMAQSLKHSRAALIKSSERTNDILESMSEGFCAFDHGWKCTYVNARAATLSRSSRDRLLGKTLWELLPDQVSMNVRAPLEHALANQLPTQFEQYYAPFDTWFEINAYPTREGLAVFGRDVSERKRFNDRLQQVQKLESLGVLAGGIAHDFNNLLTGIMGNASLVLEDLAEGSAQHADLQRVVDATQRAATLTRQLLAYAGKGRFVIEPLNLSDVVREISGLIQSSVPRTVELRLQLAQNLPSIDGDAAQIQQLIMNLVINGAEAIGDNVGRVVVTTGLKEVDETYLRQSFGPSEISPGEYVLLDVNDSGCGMDKTTMARIFDPFFTTKFAGRGLGLAAVLGIVRGHKGALRVYSTPGAGSSFKALFPVSQSQAPKRVRETSDMDLEGIGTILVIDDEEPIRQIARAILTRYGYSVLTAENGPQGIELLREHAAEVSLVLLDMTMPLLSGEETLHQLRAISPSVPIVLCSGYHEVEFEQRFAGQGAAGFIQKPFTAAYLAGRIKMALSKANR
jgi:PAS domain S-box-containing protein